MQIIACRSIFRTVIKPVLKLSDHPSYTFTYDVLAIYITAS